MSEVLAYPSPPDFLFGMVIGVIFWYLLKFLYHAFISKDARELSRIQKDIDALETRHEINKLKRRKGMLERKFPRG